MRVATVVGARPQFIKAAIVSRALRQRQSKVEEVLIHTGQHFDTNMSDVFFQQMKIPRPDYHLGIGGVSHGAMTGRMLEQLEQVFLADLPDVVLVYGDTNSTLAGALAAIKLHIPVAHIEAGLRSHNRHMPEEHNRVLTDHMADVLFCPTAAAVANLGDEGIKNGVHLVGDVMYDATLHFSSIASRPSDPVLDRTIGTAGFCLMTLHRAENTDNQKRLRNIVEAVNGVPERQVVFPVHPRTRTALNTTGLSFDSHVVVTDPVGYLEMLWLEKHADLILTDSGGVQKEAYFLGKPCGTLRDETEWVETVEAGANVILSADSQAIRRFMIDPPIMEPTENLYGAGDAGDRIVSELLNSR